MEGIKSNATAKLRKIPKKCLLPLPPAIGESIEQVRVYVWARAQEAYFEGDYVGVAVLVCPTITLQYYHSGNFLTARLIARSLTNDANVK
jgi:hypothetical protein